MQGGHKKCHNTSDIFDAMKFWGLLRLHPPPLFANKWGILKREMTFLGGSSFDFRYEMCQGTFNVEQDEILTRLTHSCRQQRNKTNSREGNILRKENYIQNQTTE